MKNLFLTGKINVGKTTVLNSILDNKQIDISKISGFLSKAYLVENKVKGFYIEPININIELPPFEKRIIGYTPDGSKWIGVSETFESFGVNLLKQCMAKNYNFIIMDELGFFESDASSFQNMVHKILSSEKNVLGVLKPISIPFMNSIRNRKDVVAVEITRDNRNTIASYLSSRFGK